jgi:alkanesulfonate monooxygenase SsuD/methylene tetrahydromethanopterin reductase-like flavin-dependent oxidoreductase (luciferase family)
LSLDQRFQASRLETNPLFNERKLKLGTFSTNLDYGAAITTLDGTLKIDWPSTLTLARIADEMEFEALVPVGRWKGFGGVTNFNGPGFETFSWAAGIGASTTYPAVFATSHIPTVHPVMAAKQATTIDHITNGRFALNVVNGWSQPEFDMFGISLAGNATRYEMAQEWIDVIKRLWTEEDEFDFEGKFYTVRKGYLQPKPIQTPHPVIMSAPTSLRGREWAARNADVVFAYLHSRVLDTGASIVKTYREKAREFGREVQVWTVAYVVQGETEQEAKDLLHEYVDLKGDWQAAENMARGMGLDTKALPKAIGQEYLRNLIGGWGGYPIVGTKEQIVETLKALSERVGVDGVLLSWARYEAGMREFRQKTLPLLVQAGLR